MLKKWREVDPTANDENGEPVEIENCEGRWR